MMSTAYTLAIVIGTALLGGVVTHFVVMFLTRHEKPPMTFTEDLDAFASTMHQALRRRK